MAFYEVLQTLHILQRNICKISNTSKTRNQLQKKYVLQILQSKKRNKILQSKKCNTKKHCNICKICLTSNTKYDTI